MQPRILIVLLAWTGGIAAVKVRTPALEAGTKYRAQLSALTRSSKDVISDAAISKLSTAEAELVHVVYDAIANIAIVATTYVAMDSVIKFVVRTLNGWNMFACSNVKIALVTIGISTSLTLGLAGLIGTTVYNLLAIICGFGHRSTDKKHPCFQTSVANVLHRLRGGACEDLTMHMAKTMRLLALAGVYIALHLTKSEFAYWVGLTFLFSL